MFPALRLEVIERFTAVERYLRAYTARQFAGELSQTAKGLVFVQIYAIHEYAVKTAVDDAAKAVAAYGHRFNDLRHSLLALFLNAELQSLRDRDHWERRMILLARAQSRERAVAVDEGVVPADGSHFRHTHVQLILKVFGIKRKLTLRERHLFLIDEVVFHRNEIAHGNSTAAQVGRGFSNEDMRTKIRQMKAVLLRLIRLLEDHCADPTKHKK